MNLGDSLLAVGMNDLLDVVGQTISLGGKSIKAVVSPIQVQDEWQNGGHNASKAASIAIRKSDSSPEVGDLVTAGGVTYQIIRIDEEGPGLTLTCSTPVN